MKEEVMKLFEQKGFISNNKIKIEEIEKDKVVLKAELTENSMNPYQMVHGGLIFGLGDTAMGLLSSIEKIPSVTLDANINYLKPAEGLYLKAEASIIKKGKNICYLRAKIYNDKQEVVATMNSNYYYLNERR